MIHWIELPDDPRLDPYRQVGDPARLRADGLFVAEGRLVVARLLAKPDFPLRSILVTPAALQAMRAELLAAPCDTCVCDPRMLQAITGFNFHRGCLALAERASGVPPDELFGGRLLLGIERVGNPDNIGGLFRTAAAFGADAVVLDRGSGDPLYRKAIRTSMGATLQLPFGYVDAWPAWLAEARAHGWLSIALTPAGESLPIEEAVRSIAPDARLLLLVGAEGEGLQDETLAAADLRVRIRIAAGVDSLNVVVAAGVALHRVTTLPAGQG
jgi:tRNA G18 (ribose-2'-O)-methylase SpoU